MLKIKEKNQGITLIALVITIIVLLILAGVSIATLTGENGIIGKAEEARDANKIAEYKDRIELARGEKALEKLGIVTLDDLIDQIYKDEIVPEGNITKIDEEMAELVTEECYIFHITGDTTEYIKKGVMPKEPPTIYASLNEGVLSFFSTEEAAKANGGKFYEGNIGEMVFERGTTGWPRPVNTPWYDDRTQVTKVIFEDKITPNNLEYYFYGLENITEIEKIENLDTKNVTSMKMTFYKCEKLSSINVSGFSTINVTNMNNLFGNCTALTSIDVGSLDTRRVKDMDGLFGECTNLRRIENLEHLDTRNVIDMAYMFQNCNNLEQVNLSNFRTDKVVDMQCMFCNCSKLMNIDLSNFDTRNMGKEKDLGNGTSGLR